MPHIKSKIQGFYKYSQMHLLLKKWITNLNGHMQILWTILSAILLDDSKFKIVPMLNKYFILMHLYLL